MKKMLAMAALLLVQASLIVQLEAVFAQRPALSSQVEPYVAVDFPVVALTSVRIIDGTGAPAMEDQTILVDGTTIAQVGGSDEVVVPEGAHVVDLAGHTVIPGLIGLHNHTFYMTSQRSIQLNYSAPRLYLASGVTTIRTTGSNAPYSELNLKQAIDSGDAPGPRIFVTGPYLTGGTGMSNMTRLSGPDDARRVVAYWAEEGVSWFKVYTEISREELAAVVDEAHKHGIKVTGHVCSVSFQEAVALGIDNLEHGFFTNTDYDTDRAPDDCPNDFRESLFEVDMDGEAVQATFRDMIDNDVAMTSTLAIYEMYVPGRPPIEERVLEAMSPEVRQEYMRTREQIAEAGKDPTYTFRQELFDRALKYEYDFVKAGGLLASGVDPTGYGGALPGYGDQRNYELLLEAGFTPVEVIRIMTSNGARVLDIDDEVGTIEAGKLADLVVIEGNPIKTPTDIRNVRIVFKDGIGYDSAKLIESVEGTVGVR